MEEPVTQTTVARVNEAFEALVVTLNNIEAFFNKEPTEHMPAMDRLQERINFLQKNLDEMKSFWSSRDGEGEETREEDDANEGDEENIDINATF